MDEPNEFTPAHIAGFIMSMVKQPDIYKDVRGAASLLLRDATAEQVSEVAQLLPDELKRYLPLKSI